MKIIFLKARATGLALALFLSVGAQGAPEPSRLIGPNLLNRTEPGLLLQSTVIKVQQIWDEPSLKIITSLPVEAHWLPEGGQLMRQSTVPSGDMSVTLSGQKILVTSGRKSVVTSKLSLTGAGMKVGGVDWPRRVDLLPGKDGKLWVIYHLNLENYVAGVLPHEMSLSWPMEALKAQAIAIRTYASYQMERHKNRSFHVHSTTKDQVFKLEDVRAPWRSKLEAVVASTKGQILKDNSGKVASIFYHADCGGSAERSPWVWSHRAPSGAPIQCAHHSSISWKLEVTGQELVKKLGRDHREITGNIDEVLPTKKSASGRLEELSILMDSGVALNMRPEELRRALGPDQLKSARFVVRPVKDGIEFTGYGYGHGVGLCQRGSKAWAEQGKASAEILKIYYPTLSVTPAHSQTPPSKWAAR